MDNVLRLLLLPLFLAAKQVVDCLLRMMTQEIYSPVPSDSPHPEAATERSTLRAQDLVALRSNPSLIGTVSQTYRDADREPVEDALIIAHAPVPSSAIHSFATNGFVPKGFIFVQWTREECGHSLLGEEQVILLDRFFNIGDTVKTAVGDSVVGTVVNVSESYTLEPIAHLRDGVLDFRRCNYPNEETLASSRSSHTPGMPSPVLHYPSPAQTHELLYNIPGEELRRVDDFVEGDFVFRKDWIGVVEDTDVEVVLLLEDNTLVVPRNPEELELVIPNFGKPLITLPDLDGIRRPDVVTANVDGIMSTPCSHLRRGQFVVTNRKNIQEGRWLSGTVPGDWKPQGYILDCRTLRLDVQWLCPNAFALETPAVVHGPASNVRPYENLGTFNSPSDLRRNKSVVLYDRLRQPRASNSNDNSQICPGHGTMRSNCVTFRDLPGAALKYGNGRHGRFERISKESTFGVDVNEFEVVDCRQEVQILWQDQRVTRERSNTLLPYTLPEAELCPGDIVTLKHGTKQVEVGRPDHTAVDFNEMLYFQGNFRLLPGKIGVVQSVDSKERLARLRLFEDPKVELLEQGNVLKAGSRLGLISDVVEEVSLYEIMSHPALLRRRGDLVILPPERPHYNVIQQLQSNTNDCPLGPSTLSYLRSVHPASKFEHLRNIAKHYVQNCVSPQNGISATSQTSPSPSLPFDWVGEIIDLRTDGLATVRLGALGSECHDIQVPFEHILMIVDDDADLDDGSSMMSDVDPWSEDRSGSDDDNDDESAFLEEVEYEGGERLDDDSDSVWMTDNDENDAHREDAVMDDPPALCPLDGAQDPNRRALPVETELSTSSLPETLRTGPSINDLAALRPVSGCPPESFAILESEPPSDQFAVEEASSAISAAFLRRINREHRILSTSLPAREIYVRTYESRLDLLRCLIVGPKDTPYEGAPFVIDLQLSHEFPQVPPVAYFHSWTGGLGRINPNLYEEGKICLSLLNTWPGQSEGESWSEKASILQILISLMGLVLVNQPFYNEAGFESYGEEKLYTRESQQYSEKAYVMARKFVKHALSSPVKGLEEVLAYLYLPPITSGVAEIPTSANDNNEGLLEDVIKRSNALIAHSALLRGSDEILVDGAGQTDDSTKTFLRPLSQGAVVMLKKTVSSLKELLERVENGDVEPSPEGTVAL